MKFEDLKGHIATLNLDHIEPAIFFLFERDFLVFEGEEFSAQAIRYLRFLANHIDPLGAAHLLVTLTDFGLLDEDYRHTPKNTHAVVETVYCDKVASVLDRVYSKRSSREKSQAHFDLLLRLAHAESEAVERTFAFLQVRIRERIMASPASWSEAAFEDELSMAVHSIEANRDNLSALAYDSESAIQPLTASEKRRLEKAIEYYAPLIDAKGGVEACYQSLLDVLAARYRHNPPRLFFLEPMIGFLGARDARVFQLGFQLPLEWDDFVRLPLTAANRKRALELYYADTVHTAYRFFKEVDKPGPWIADKRYWERFSFYKNTLVMLWLAVTDEKMPPIEDYTIEGRIEHFIRSFAEFRRDKNNQGRRLGPNGKYAYYDDLQPDKPGCNLGFHARVYDAVQGHPLFNSLTPQLLLKEVEAYVFSHFDDVLQHELTMGELEQLALVWKNIIEAEPCDTSILEKLNIPESLQETWLETLKAKYVDLSQDAELTQRYHNFFQLNTLFPTHSHRFGGVCLEPLLERRRVSRSMQFSLPKPFVASPVKLSDAPSLLKCSPETNPSEGSDVRLQRFR